MFTASLRVWCVVCALSSSVGIVTYGCPHPLVRELCECAQAGFSVLRMGNADESCLAPIKERSQIPP